jgi:hypothetical protein
MCSCKIQKLQNKLLALSNELDAIKRRKGVAEQAAWGKYFRGFSPLRLGLMGQGYIKPGATAADISTLQFIHQAAQLKVE